MSLHRKIARLVFYGALALVTAAPAAAQQTESRIVGKITDASGAVLPGVDAHDYFDARPAPCARP